LHYKLHWIIPFIFECLILFGLAFVHISTLGYITDSLREYAPEAFATLNLESFYEFGKLIDIEMDLMIGMNYFFANWITNSGPLQVFCVCGLTHILVTSLTIPMYIYGKRARSFTARKKFFQTIMGK
jgi:hypothetical protein